MPAIATCTCSKKKTMNHMDIVKGKYEVTQHVDGVCIYCGYYVHWRTPQSLSQTIEEYTRCETRCIKTIKEEMDLRNDEVYVYGCTISI